MWTCGKYETRAGNPLADATTTKQLPLTSSRPERAAVRPTITSPGGSIGRCIAREGSAGDGRVAQPATKAAPIKGHKKSRHVTLCTMRH